jgi:LacI family transcriptional regulator
VVCINGPLGQFAHAIQIDDRKGARLAIEHLAELGHTRIAHITGAVGVPTRQERLAGYRAALRDVGLHYDPSLVITGVASVSESREAAARLLSLRDRPTAIFAYNDRWAIGAYGAIRDAGLRIGPDVSVVGFDDIVMDEWVHPALTTVRQPRREMGRIAVDLLLAVLRGERASDRVVVEPNLVVRGSTARRSAHADRH